MTNLDRIRVDRDARRTATALTPPSAYGAAVNCYLGASGYLDRIPTPTASADPIGTSAAVRPTIMVGVHESPASSIAVDHAGIEAELRGADLRPILVQAAMREQSSERDRGAALLAHLVDRVHAGTTHVAAASRLLVGAPAALLLDEVRDADLVLVGSEHGPISDAVGASVGAHIAADHPGPVIVVRMPVWPAGTDFTTRPVVVDGTASGAAVAFGIEEARLRGCELILLHATDKLAGQKADPELPFRQDETKGVTVHHRTVQGPVTTALTEASLHAAAVVVGGRGRSGLPRLLLGSVGQQLIRQAHCPVFIVR